MPLFAGPLVTRRRCEPGWIRVEQGRLTAQGMGEPSERPDVTGWIVPAPVNAHTHIGDAWLKEVPRKPHSVAELFGPGGWKHRHLAAADGAQQTLGANRLAQQMAACGTAGFIDFREGGATGATWLQGLDLPVPAMVLGRGLRPGFDEEEARAVLDACDGIGLSGLRDFERFRDLESWADAAHDAGKPLAIHVSEDTRDDIDAAISLEPTFVVHMTMAKPADLERLADERIPIVVCPRSNAHFGHAPPVDAMLAAGCKVAVGTDNGMLQDGDLWSEIRLLHRTHPDVPLADLLGMACHHGRELMGLHDPVLRKGGPVDHVVIPHATLEPQATKPRLDVP